MAFVIAQPAVVSADELSLESVSANGQVKEVIKSVLKNVKTTPGSTPGTVEFSVPGLVHGTVHIPAKDSNCQTSNPKSKDEVLQTQTEASLPLDTKDLAAGGAMPADRPSLDIHFDGDGEVVGLPKGAVPNALDWLMPGKAKRPGRNLPPALKGLEQPVNAMPPIMP